MDVTGLARSLRREAERANERRLLVLAGDRRETRVTARSAVSSIDAGPDGVTVVTAGDETDSSEGSEHTNDDERRSQFPAARERLPPSRADELLGTTREVVVLDAHAGFSPNVLGTVVGAVDGGGLLVLLSPPLSSWPDHRTGFDDTMAVPPFELADVAGRFRRRLVETLRTHPGVAIVDVDAETVERDGLTDPTPAPASDPDFSPPPNASFPDAAYEACLTADQRRAVRALESLGDPGHAVVVESDRGRGKSSAAGLAAGALAARGADVLVTGPSVRAARECFERAAELLEELDQRRSEESLDGPEHRHANRESSDASEGSRQLSTTAGGRIRFVAVADAVDLPESPDAVIVDEAAALPVRRLEAFLAAPAVAFCTTVHGYEGTGRGFDVRFRERLTDADMRVETIQLSEPIRYAAGDPLESWSFRALLLDASPAVAPAIEDATPATVSYRAPTAADLLADEYLLREAFGLLVLAHYRTEPNDLARVLDAPNLRVRLLTHGGHVVSVALLAREGGLDADTRASMYEGSRVRGNMLPDVLTSQLRDEAAAVPVGYRVVRIATHHAVRDRGLGSSLLEGIEAEIVSADETKADAVEIDSDETDSDETESAQTERGPTAAVDPDRRLEAVDWLGVGYGATPDLLRFWAGNGYRTVHFSTTRNETSGEYSAIMLKPVTQAGTALHDRHGRRFRDRVIGLLSDPVSDADPDVVRAMLRTVPAAPDPSLSDYEQRVAASAAYGPGLSDVAPGVFRELALAGFLAESPLATLDARQRRLLVRKCLQAHRWTRVAEELHYDSRSECLRAFGETIRPLVEAFCGPVARAERERYSEPPE